MSAILDAVLDQARMADILRNATVYRAAVGTRKAYANPNDADAHNRGWAAYFDGRQCPRFAPESTGWLEAERAQHDARELRLAERKDSDA